MIKAGKLTDAEGEKLTDMSEIDFAKPMSEQLVDVMGQIRNLIQTFIDTLTPIGDAATAVDNIPDNVNVDVAVTVPVVPPIKIDWEITDPTNDPDWPGGEHKIGIVPTVGAGKSARPSGAAQTDGQLAGIERQLVSLVSQGRESPRKIAQQITQRFRDEGAFN